MSNLSKKLEGKGLDDRMELLTTEYIDAIALINESGGDVALSLLEMFHELKASSDPKERDMAIKIGTKILDKVIPNKTEAMLTVKEAKTVLIGELTEAEVEEYGD